MVARSPHSQQINFISAFLNSMNKFEIYIEQPKGFEEEKEVYVWRLLKTLYGTMQRAYDWAKNLDCMYKGHRYYKSYTNL